MSDVTDVEELPEPEFTLYADSANISNNGFFL